MTLYFPYLERLQSNADTLFIEISGTLSYKHVCCDH